jgi:phage tail-like protein
MPRRLKLPESGARNDPFLAFRFEVRFDNLSVAGFSECSGLQLEIEVQDHMEGGLNTFVRKFPGRTKQTNIQLKRGIVDREMWNWYYDLTQGRLTTRNGSIRIHDTSGAPVQAEWQFRDAFPSKWVGPDLNASQNNVAVETMEICHQGLERIT